MGTQARVATTDAFESFRASLIVFLGKARRAVDDAGDEVRKTRGWLQHDQYVHWEGELRRRTKLLDQAQQELRSAQFTGNRDSVLMQRQVAVHKATQSVEEAEAKLRCVKKWNQSYDNNADPILKRLEGIRQYLEIDLPKAITFLNSARETLERYSDLPPGDSVASTLSSSNATGDSPKPPAPL
jgi:hypothetical protein